MINLVNKVAVVTGAASGIGKALAMKCLNEGMQVIFVDIDHEELMRCAKELLNDRQAFFKSVDVSNEKEVHHLAHYVMDNFGAVHYLFNNAGIPGAIQPLWEQSTADIEQVLSVNLMGTIHGIKAFVPFMLKQIEESYIVNTCAGAGLLTGVGLSAYKASKHAIMAISEVLLADLKKVDANIHVAVLIPHLVDTQIAKKLITDDKNKIEESVDLLKKYGQSANFVADQTFIGLKEKRFYLFTDSEEHLPKIRERMEKILNLQNPV